MAVDCRWNGTMLRRCKSPRNIRTGVVWIAAIVAALIRGGYAQGSAQNRISDLGGTSWQLVKFEGGDDTILTPDDRAKYTLAFGADGTVSVRVDCNRGHGTWNSSEPTRLEIGPMAMTRAMCPPAPLNDRLAKDWQYVRSYILKDGHLFLALMADAGVYEFEPVSPDDQASGAAIGGLPATFFGELPCADCPGIRYQLNLLADHKFVSRMTYEERDRSFEERGSWHLVNDGKTLVLQSGSKTSDQLAMVDADTLRKLDTSGHQIESKLNYDLKRSPKFMAIENRSRGVKDASLENTDWKLTALADTAVAAAAQAQTPYLLLSSETHQVSGSGGCNRFTGSYEKSGDRLTFSKTAGTMMECLKGMETEQGFLKALAQVKAWKITERQLEFLDADGKVIARFEPRQGN